MARPLTHNRKVLFIASAFVAGCVLEMLVTLYVCAFLQSGLLRFLAAIAAG